MTGYDWKIGAKKFITGWAYAAVPFTLLYSIEFLETEELPPEYAVYTTLAIGILHWAVNAWKHRNG
jgi:hypothetical protein